MSARRAAVLAAVLAALVLVQVYGLDRQPETREEEKYRNLADMPASDMVPTYIASLFFGAFRAVVVDALWIQLKRVEEEKRWYERREVLKLISYFQPRNPEVWSHLGWHSAYNVANGFTDPEKAWEWVKFGLEWLRKGNTMLPDSPYLKFELARTLYHKPSWREGTLDRDLLSRIEGDAELQRTLRTDPAAPVSGPLSAFELAAQWLARGRDELFARRDRYVLTQSGLYIRPLTMDGFIRECLFYQSIYLWQSRRFDEARESFRRAAEHTHAMIAKTQSYGETVSSLFEDQAKFYARLPEIVDLDRRARSGAPADERAFLEKLQAVIVEFGPLDLGFLWGRTTKTGRLDLLKQKLAGGKDLQECNDSFDLATGGLESGALLLANMDPPGLDVDFYRIDVLEPPTPNGSQPGPGSRIARPMPLTVQVRRPEGAGLDLRISLLDTSRRVLATAEGSGDLKLQHTCEIYGAYTVKVEPLTRPDPWPANTSYSFRYDLRR